MRRAGTPSGPPDLTIIYSGDLRGVVASPIDGAGGVARRATLVDRMRLWAAVLVQVDAGDVVPSLEDEPRLDDATRAARAELVLRAYGRMGVDAMTVGERDLALGVPTLRALCDKAKVRVVAANVADRGGRLLFPSERIIRAGGVTVGVFGVLDLQGESWTAPDGVTVTDPLAAARTAVDSLRAQGARVVIGLFHVAGGLARARAIAGATTGVDLIVLAHAGHGSAAAPPQIVTSALRGAEVGRVDVRFAGGGALRLEDRVLATTPDDAEQLGVRLLVRVASGPIPATLTESLSALRKATGYRHFGEDWTYATSPLCVACHPTQGAQWQTTDHAHAFATLEDTSREREPLCMGCHMTGFLMPGGPQNFETATSQFSNVGCEACHGPSSAHVASGDKHKGTSRLVDPSICLGCHTPDQNGGRFVVADAMKKIIGPGHGRPPTPAPGQAR